MFANKWNDFFQSGCHLCWNDNHPTAVLCGCTLNSVALLDVEVDKTLYHCDTQVIAPLSGLLFASEAHKFFTLSNNGGIELWDTRMKTLATYCDDKNDLTIDHGGTINYAMDVCGNSYEDSKLACVSRLEKQVVLYELRQWKKPLASIPLGHGPKTSDNKYISIKVMYIATC